MDLFCIELNSEPKAISDPVFLDDHRVLENLMTTEQRYTIASTYFKCLQTDLEPYMRRVVAGWMLDVCEEERCQQEVFPLAINILDRFLSIVKIRKCQLQLVCSVCLFLASKLRQSEPLSAEKLILYTDKSITIDELMGWELLVLNKLKWDLPTITANDFLNVLLRRLHKWLKVQQLESLIKRHSQTFIALCAAEIQFSCHLPSLIAAASIATAVRGFQFRSNQKNSFDVFLNTLANTIGIDAIRINMCVHQIESLIGSSTTLTQGFVTQTSAFNSHNIQFLENIQTNIDKYSDFQMVCNDIKINIIDRKKLKH